MFLLVGMVHGQVYQNSVGSYSSPARYNIVDGIIPPQLSAAKGCKRDLRLSKTMPVNYVDISCADIRYSVFDKDQIYMSTTATVERKYTEKLTEHVNGICKLKIPSLNEKLEGRTYANGKQMEFLNRYGDCEGTLEDSVFTESITNELTGCGDVDKEPILTRVECNIYLGNAADDPDIEIFDSTKPYGCFDNSFNSFDRRVDLQDQQLTDESQALMNQRIDQLRSAAADVKPTEGFVELLDPPEYIPYEILEIACSTFDNCLKSMVQYINSIWAKQRYYDSLVTYLRAESLKMGTLRSNYVKYKHMANILIKAYGQTDTIDNTYFNSMEETFSDNYDIAVERKNSISLTEEKSALHGLLYGSDGICRFSGRVINATGVFENDILGCVPGCDMPNSVCAAEREPSYVTKDWSTHKIYRGGVNLYANGVDTWEDILATIGTSLTRLGVESSNYLVTDGKCPFNYLCVPYKIDRGFRSTTMDTPAHVEFHEDPQGYPISTYTGVDEDGYETWSTSYVPLVTWSGRETMMDFESIYRALACAPFCFGRLESIVFVEDNTIIPYNPTTRQESKPQTNKRIILGDIYNMEKAFASGFSITNNIEDLYKEFVQQNLACADQGEVGDGIAPPIPSTNVECGGEKCFLLGYDTKEVAIEACSQSCYEYGGFALHWDQSPQRQTSRAIKNRRLECRCGEPVNEVDCMMLNKIWDPDIYVTQYTFVPTNPLFERSVTYTDKFLFCPVGECSDGYVSEKCEDQNGQICAAGRWHDNGCHTPDGTFCKNGFVEEECMCHLVSCEPGWYCTKTGDCKKLVSTAKHILHARYKHITDS